MHMKPQKKWIKHKTIMHIHTDVLSFGEQPIFSSLQPSQQVKAPFII
jgi:hypothetical protein